MRLRVPLNEVELAAVHAPAQLDVALYEKLMKWITAHYRDRLNLADFQDVSMVEEKQAAQAELMGILRL